MLDRYPVFSIKPFVIFYRFSNSLTLVSSCCHNSSAAFYTCNIHRGAPPRLVNARLVTHCTSFTRRVSVNVTYSMLVLLDVLGSRLCCSMDLITCTLFNCETNDLTMYGNDLKLCSEGEDFVNHLLHSIGSDCSQQWYPTVLTHCLHIR